MEPEPYPGTIGDLISIHPKIRLNFFDLQGVRKILGCTFLGFFTLLQGVRQRSAGIPVL